MVELNEGLAGLRTVLSCERMPYLAIPTLDPVLLGPKNLTHIKKTQKLGNFGY